jgi:regulatory protein
LRRRGAPPDVAAAVVAELVARGYVDDAAFARAWVQTRSARGYGADRLRAELRRRGVAPAVVEAALAAIDADSALERARALARRRLPVLRRARPDRVAIRLADALRRRGYAPAIVARIVRECGGSDAGAEVQ